MKRLNSYENGEVSLEIVECDCGFHLGIDASYLLQVGDVKIECPACRTVLDTAVVCPRIS